MLSFPSEIEAFRQLQKLLGPDTVQLIDTYDTIEGARRTAKLGGPLWGVRLDSGNIVSLAGQVREILDQAGLHGAKIMASGDLDEYKIRDIVASGAPVDAFGVGTELATSGDAPSMGTVYKLVELDISGIKRFTAKFSEFKQTLPGAKQLFRLEDRDVLARSGECCTPGAEALLRPVILGGNLVEPLPDVHAARARAAEYLAKLPPEIRELDSSATYRVELSSDLEKLIERTRRNLA